MDWHALLTTIAGAAVPVLGAAWAMATRIQRLAGAVEHLRADVDRALTGTAPRRPASTSRAYESGSPSLRPAASDGTTLSPPAG